VSVAWNAASDNVGVAKYEVWRGDSSYNNWVLAGSVSGSTLSFANTGLSGGPFASNSPFNITIPSSPKLDPNSAGIVANIAARPGIADIYEFGVPVWE